MHTHACTRTYTHVRACKCTCVRVHAHTHMLACVCTCAHPHIPLHMCTHMYTCVHTQASRHYSCAQPYTPCTCPDCSPSQRPRDRHHHRHIFRSPPTPPSPAISFLAKPSVLTEVTKLQGTQMVNTGHLGTTGSSTLSRPCYVTSELSMICFTLSLIYISHSLQHASCTMQSAHLNFILTTNLQGR